MTDKIEIDYLEEGDSFTGSPMEQSVFISEVLAAGGSVKIDGNDVHITSLPTKETSKAKAPVSPKKAAETPKKEAPKVEAIKQAPKVKAVDPEVAIAPIPKTASDKTKE